MNRYVERFVGMPTPPTRVPAFADDFPYPDVAPTFTPYGY